MPEEWNPVLELHQLEAALQAAASAARPTGYEIAIDSIAAGVKLLRMHSGTQIRRVTFPISEVKPATVQLPEISTRAALEKTVQAPLLTCPQAEQRIVQGEDFHPLIAAAAIAFKHHYPLVLSPDMIWIAVLQGVAQHIANNSEALRSRLVLHQTKIELIVDTDLVNLPKTDAEMVATTREFMNQIRKHSLPDKHFLLRTEFSTTTDVERIVGAVAVMDAFQHYFDYIFACICGIPSVTLEGTSEDWTSLAAKVQMLHDSDLELSWWTKHLIPLCAHFIRASNGDVDKIHWSDLFKLVERYGVDDLNGWLLKFIPYVRHDRNEALRHRNPVLEFTEYRLDNEPHGKIIGCTSKMLPSGLSAAPTVCWNRQTGAQTPLRFIAGFTGTAQSPKDLSLRPVMGWAIAERTKIDRLLWRLQTEHEVAPAKPIEIDKLVKLFDGYLPADLWKFYSEFEDAVLKSKGAGDFRCLIKPWSEHIDRVQHAVNFEHVNRELQHLLKQGVIGPSYYAERRDFARDYRHFLVFAEVTDGEDEFHYVFGHDPEKYSELNKHNRLTIKESRGEIFRWNGEPTRDSFEPVAHTFCEWLEAMLDRATGGKPA